MNKKQSSKAGKYMIVILFAALLLGSYLIWFQPWQVGAPSTVRQPENTATVFQAFFITYQSGTTRWYYAPERAVALSIIGVDEVNEAVTKVQTHVFMNVNYAAKTVSSWTFSANARFMIYSKTGGGGAYTLVKDFGVQPLSTSGTALQENKDVWLLSSSMTQPNIDQLVDFSSSTLYSFKVELRNIKITVNYSDGTSVEMTTLGGPANDLEWDFIYV